MLSPPDLSGDLTEADQDAAGQMAAILRISANTIRQMSADYGPTQKELAFAAAKDTDRAAEALERCAVLLRDGRETHPNADVTHRARRH